MITWRSIDTAPRDGTRVLTYDPTIYDPSLKDIDPVYGNPYIGMKVNRVQQGWPDNKIHWQESGRWAYWMPLPLPPEGEQK